MVGVTNGHGSESGRRFDVIAIGGGPTGLLTAVLARQLGLSACVIDAKTGPLELGRADAMNARTQQYLEVAGVLEELLPQGITCNTSSTFGDGEFKSRQNTWWTGLEYCYRKNFLMLGQPAVEKALLDHLSLPEGKQDATVLYGESVVSLSETDKNVTVTTDKGTKLTGRYAVVADGARSKMRSDLGISFTGTKPEMVWAVLDTFLDTDFPRCDEIITFQLEGKSRVSWIPREREMARFYVLLEGEGDITQARAEAEIQLHLAPYKVSFPRTEWFSTFEVKERVASTFVTSPESGKGNGQGKGRVLLAGDAAHVHSVNGGQGLNTGVADAFALAWRLRDALKAEDLGAPDTAAKLLRSYDAERRKTAEGVIAVAAALVRDTVHTAKQYVGTIERNAGYITGMGVSYDGLGSELISESEQSGTWWKAGRRCPDLVLTRRSGSRQTKRLYEMVKYGTWLVLHVGNSGSSKVPPPGTGATDPIHWTLVPAGGSASALSDAHGAETADVFECLEKGVFDPSMDPETEGFMVVVRPDMYVGYVGPAP